MSLFIIRFISPISKCVHNIPSGNLLNCHINVILCKLNIYLSMQGGGWRERKNKQLSVLERERDLKPIHLPSKTKVSWEEKNNHCIISEGAKNVGKEEKVWGCWARLP